MFEQKFYVIDYLKLIDTWFGIRTDKYIDLSQNIKIIKELVDCDGKKILIIALLEEDHFEDKLWALKEEYNSDMLIIALHNKEGLVNTIQLSLWDDEELNIVNYIYTDNYITRKFLIDKVKIAQLCNIKSMKKLFSIEPLKADFRNDIIQLVDWFYPTLNGYFKDPSLAIEYGRERLIYSVINQFPIDDLCKSYLIEELLSTSIKSIDCEEIINNMINLTLSKYEFILNENVNNDITIAITPDVLADLVQELLHVNIKKKNGVYYSPKRIVKYICSETISYYLMNNREISREILDYIFIGRDCTGLDNDEIGKQIHIIIEELKGITIAEPSVGCGEFLVGALNNILFVYEKIHQLSASIGKERNFNRLKIVRELIKDSLYGVDIEPAALLITKFRLFLSMYNLEGFTDEEIKHISMNISIGNSLYQDDILMFDWESRYPKVFSSGGFDVVLGNPPYVGEKGNKELFRKIFESEFGKTYYQGKMDLFYFFFHKAIDIAKEGGIISFITTNYYVTANGGNKLRDDIKTRTSPLKFINFNNIKLFDMAKGQHDLITILKREAPKEEYVTEVYDCKGKGNISNLRLQKILSGEDVDSNYFKVKSAKLFDPYNGHIRITNGYDEVLSKLLNNMSKYPRLGDFFNINQGIVSGADKLSPRHMNKYDIDGQVGEGIFVLSSEEITKLNLSQDEMQVLMPFYKNSDIRRFKSSTASDKTIIYFDKDIMSIDGKYKKIEAHLKRFYPILVDRREVVRGYINYFNLQWSRKREIFTSEKIVAPQRSLKNIFAYNKDEWFASADVYYITNKEEKHNLKYLTALLNSDIYYLWLYHRGKRKGEILEMYQTPLKEVPYLLNDEISRNIGNLVDDYIAGNAKSVVEINNRVEEYLFRVLELSENEKQRIKYIINDK